MNTWKGKKVAVVGLGVEGKASVQYLKKHGAKVTGLDQKQGRDYLNDLNHFDLIVRSPGVHLKLLRNINPSKITSQTKLFFDLCPCQIIGVTGTKGKGTTASLIYEMLKREDVDVYLGGNIGKPPLDFLDKLNPQSVVVLELSSFQLMDLTKSPHIAVMLMTTSEHLDWHKDTEEYINAKRNILRFQNSSDFAIVNRDYPASNESDVETSAKIFHVSRERDGEQGCFIEGNKIIVHRDGRREKIISINEILLPGKHNLENVCAAVMVALISHIKIPTIVEVLKTFKGLEHRLELVGDINGVRYYDDSFSTIPETAIAAIESFKNPEILILGGSSKNSDFTELGKVISSSSNIKAIIGIGVEWPNVKSKITHSTSSGQKSKIIEGLKDMGSIVRKASELASKGDVVLLSPACASFDMFKNYKDRGEQFKNEVARLSF